MTVMRGDTLSVALTTRPNDDVAVQAVFARPTVDLVLAWLRAYEETNTQEAYRRDVQQFCQWLADSHPGEPVDLLTVDREQVDKYARHLSGQRGFKPATVARKLATLASLYAYAVADRRMPHSPLEHVRRPKVSKDGKTRGLTVPELLALLDAAAAAGDRDFALVNMLIITAARMSEVVSIRIETIRPEGHHWVVPIDRKGADQEAVPIPGDVHAALIRLTTGRTHGPVFLDGDGAPLDRHDGARIIRRLARAAGIRDPKSVTPHSMRTSYATVLLTSGKAASHRVQEGMSHASLMTTERYLRSANKLDGHANYTMADLLADARKTGSPR